MIIQIYLQKLSLHEVINYNSNTLLFINQNQMNNTVNIAYLNFIIKMTLSQFLNLFRIIGPTGRNILKEWILAESQITF
jgi:hypothetical protein